MNRVGLGFDAHPFGPGRLLRLGGVTIPHPLGLRGHSDGDAVLHALADALLGAAGQGSMGEHFPDSDPAWKGADSAVFVERARDFLVERGLQIVNIDCLVIAEAPKIAPFAAEIRARLAQLLRTPPEVIGIRGTSTNGLGFAGRNEGLAAMVVVLLETAKS
jgi:2-C-methyl-D-erythritol 2,4-cyclodiphosphate synthase